MFTSSHGVVRLGAVSFALVASLASRAHAQFSSDPAAPLAVSATALDDTQARVAPAPNGSTYISYFSGSGYDVMLDRLDQSGVSMWGGPVVVEDRALSSTVDYGLASDAAGNAYISFNTVSAKTTFPVQKVTSVGPTGAIRWSSVVYTASGVTLGNGRVIVASDGFVWGGASANNTSVVQRFDAATGAASFGAAITISETSANQLMAGLQASNDGGVIVSAVRYTTFTGAKVLRAHKVNTDGTRPWAATGVPVFTTGSVQTGNFPDFISDGAGGGLFPFYTTSPLTCRVQRIDAAGNILWGTNGAVVGTSSTGTFGGTSSTLNRTNPSAILGGDGRVYCSFRAYSGSIAGIVWYGIGAQCFNLADGTTAWGADGVMVEDYAPAQAGVVYDRQVGVALGFGAGVGVAYANYSTAGAANAVAARFNADGTLAWKTTIASNVSTKFRFNATGAPSDASVISWQGGPSAGSSSDIFCARVGSDGTLGAPASAPGDVNGDGAVNATDLALLLGQWGSSGSADLNHDGTVDANDLAIVLAGWTG